MYVLIPFSNVLTKI